MNKYLKYFQLTLQQSVVYTFKFFGTHFRNWVRLFGVYMIWWAIFSYQKDTVIFSYSRQIMLTYILGSIVVRTFVLGNYGFSLASDIATGFLNKYLLQPWGIFSRIRVADLAGKFFDIPVSILSLMSIVLVFKVDFYIPSHLQTWIWLIILILLAWQLFLEISILVGMTAFWFPEHNGWPIQFLFVTVLEFLSGGIFPLDIVGDKLFKILMWLPTSYILFFPMQVFLQRIEGVQLFFGIIIMLFWILVFKIINSVVWKKGLKKYSAVGI